MNIHCSRDPKKGIVNNQLVDWSFKLDGIMHNASQEAVFNTTAVDVVTAALDGYNGICRVVATAEPEEAVASRQLSPLFCAA